MVLSEFEAKRVEKVVGAFVANRRPPPNIRKQVDLGFRVKGQSVEIFEVRPVWRGSGEVRSIEEVVAEINADPYGCFWGWRVSA
ncbi:MAG: hypothetical protein JNM76_06970 [Betaproteobacteria bacterium]|nr:hypothetical protein [Betaproteobacteria bacterium]